MREFLSGILPKLSFSSSRRELDRYTREAGMILHYSDSLDSIPDDSLHQNFQNLRGRLDRTGMMLAMAITVQFCRRVLKLEPFEVQIVGALAMCDGRIVEMATGEGKTLTAALALAWHGLNGHARVVTVNDYLARRDAVRLMPLYDALGLSCGYVQDQMGPELRQQAYQSSIVYGTPSQFVFDYLRDNQVYDFNSVLQLEHGFILIDEADSILIDEARTPLVLSGEGSLDTSLWAELKTFVGTLSYQEIPEDTRTQLERTVLDGYHIGADLGLEPKRQDAFLADQAIAKAEQFFIQQGLIDSSNELWLPSKSYLWRALLATVKARLLFHRDRDYIVRDEKVIIIDQETGRLSVGKRWNDGLHQAIECKEGVEIRPETVERGRIALANYMSLYKTVAGMTGTVATVAAEIADLYGLTYLPIPPHRPLIRIEWPDLVFMTKEAKLAKIVEDATHIHATGQPILIGTGSVEDSEALSDRFTAAGLAHNVLNAKQDENEAAVIAQAGRLNAITIATSMAGRGTDILLGGNPEFLQEGETLEQLQVEREQVLAVGGLFVLGSERLNDRRLDKQLTGRSGRQGDPGASRFYVSLEDPLLANFGGDTLKALFAKLGLGVDDYVEHRMVNKAILNAQRKKQSLYYDSRKTGLRQDSVIEMPRNVIYGLRRSALLLGDEEARNLLFEQIDMAVDRLIEVYLDNLAGFEETWDVDGLKAKLRQWGMSVDWFDRLFSESMTPVLNADRLRAELKKWIRFDLNARLKQVLSHDQSACRTQYLMAIDTLWREFLSSSEMTRNGIHLRAYANEKPELSFKNEVFKTFQELRAELPVATLDFAYGAIRQAEIELDTETAAT
jgi:preprotein translocase subunit SecA